MKFKLNIRTATAISVASSALFCVLVVTNDAVEHFQILKGDYKTPWYDARWWKQPFTHFALDGKVENIYWTSNAVGQPWRVKETTVEDKTFWTIIEKR